MKEQQTGRMLGTKEAQTNIPGITCKELPSKRKNPANSGGANEDPEK
jgi:hypothetical protein